MRFINLEAYPRFFVDMDAGFPPLIIPAPASRGGTLALPAKTKTLEVHRVGRFEASFVPTLADFARLDARFRISDDVWRALPQYADWGFAVFKLLDLKRSWLGRLAQQRTIHPMALEFPRRDGAGLYFPTVHVHDGQVHPDAAFDHMLYHQADAPLRATNASWIQQTTNKPAAQFMKVDEAAQLLDGGQIVRRVFVQGVFKNEDIWLR